MYPLVSIIIPTYNRAHLIGETLDSILEQTYTNWECIVVDDGSVDNTDEILKRYTDRDTRFKYHKRPIDRKKGANVCRNYGFELSKGEYVNWFDSDDLMYPEKLQIHCNDLIASDFDFSVTQTEQFDVKKNKVIGIRSESLFSDNLIDDFINFKTFWLFPSVLWKKKYLIKNMILPNENLQQAQDYDFHLSVLKLKPNYIHNEVITTRVILHSSNMSISMIDKPEKVLSNAYVQYRILSEFKNDISQQTFENSKTSLIKFYRTALRNKQKINSLKIFRYINLFLINDNLSYQEKVNLSVKSFLGLIYPYLNKGYRFTKF